MSCLSPWKPSLQPTCPPLITTPHTPPSHHTIVLVTPKPPENLKIERNYLALMSCASAAADIDKYLPAGRRDYGVSGVSLPPHRCCMIRPDFMEIQLSSHFLSNSCCLVYVIWHLFSLVEWYLRILSCGIKRLLASLPRLRNVAGLYFYLVLVQTILPYFNHNLFRFWPICYIRSV